MFEVPHKQKSRPVQLLHRIPSWVKYKQGPSLFTGLKCLGDWVERISVSLGGYRDGRMHDSAFEHNSYRATSKK